ncbi:hypothetical protein NDU88_004741 [Pleurodeles waltl]|uniref:Secreted protein n=1 Tax=Pleurodeles waltl TaxID=8319 RepID=A0AAV7LME5_PLEWA|nr:hypothetical protein NDU88_004740 [Pleurodeles waltl]KAJ1091624.1 hypothetical protein NDU88_004741 [Pleurodeles waltl]
MAESWLNFGKAVLAMLRLPPAGLPFCWSHQLSFCWKQGVGVSLPDRVCPQLACRSAVLPARLAVLPLEAGRGVSLPDSVYSSPDVLLLVALSRSLRINFQTDLFIKPPDPSRRL